MKEATSKITLSAMFIAIGMVLPFFTGQIQQVGSMLLPMHLPVFLCGLICGWECGAVVGFLLPLLRSVLFGMPVLYPSAVAMAFELATYGLVAGLLYGRSPWKCVKALYRSMIVAMIAGRVVWGVVEVVLLGMGGNVFTWQMFLSGALLNAIPGIVIQLTLIPAVMFALNKTGMVPLGRRDASVEKWRVKN
ncbi:MAG: ECF transporter S component [Lachnospiraceae bacterium]